MKYLKIITVVAVIAALFAVPRIKDYGQAASGAPFINQVGSPQLISNNCLYSATIQWNSYADAAQVWVYIPQTGESKLFAGDPSGSSPAPWIQVGHDYTFFLFDTTQPASKFLAQTTVYGTLLTCGSNPNPTPTPFPTFPGFPSPTPTPYPTAYPTPYPTSVYPTPYPTTVYPTTIQSGGNVAFTLTSDKQQYCVGTNPVYKLQAPAGQSFQNFHWVSTHNGVVTVDTYYQLDGAGTWPGTGSFWGTDQVGSWTKTATLGNSSQTITFTVVDCGITLNQPIGPGNPVVPSTFDFGTTSHTDQTYCVGEDPFYTILNSNRQFGIINWQSIGPDGSSFTTEFQLSGDGKWQSYGRTWVSSDIGSWTKSATIDGTTHKVTFTVKNCGTGGGA